MPSLFVTRGSDQGTRFEVAGPSLVIGRDVACQVALKDHEVSRRHAELRCEGDAFILIDLESSNGTFVNGTRIDRARLASGDQVQLGATVLLFTGASPDAVATGARIDVVTVPHGSSRIVRSMSQEEGSRIFTSTDAPGASPWLARARSNLQIMYRTALAVSHTLDINQLLDRILDLIFDWVEADRGCILLIDPETKRLEPKTRRDRRAENGDEQLTISQTILDYVLERHEGVLTSDAKDDTRWSPAASILQLGIHEAICVPLKGRYDVVGVIYIDTSIPPDRGLQPNRANKFTEEHLKLMVAIGHQAALAVEDTRYYSAMVQAERLAAIGQTIATLSHHIKNILQGIRGGSYLIEMGLSNHDENVLRKGWDIVERNQKKISNLVLDMLTFSKQREPEWVASDLNAVVSDVVELMRSRAAELGVTLEFRPQADIPEKTFDPEGLHRAILNVVTNALDACEGRPDARVGVRTSFDEPASLLAVEVEDNGVGIAPADRERIFSPFISQKGSRGTGLGLPVSRKILEEHGGQIRVESQLGQGSRFILELPAVVRHDDPESVAQTHAGPAT